MRADTFAINREDCVCRTLAPPIHTRKKKTKNREFQENVLGVESLKTNRNKGSFDAIGSVVVLCGCWMCRSREET